MTIQHGIIHSSTSYAKPSGHDLRDTAVGGAVRYGSPEAVARFREILAARDVGQREVGTTSPSKVEHQPMEQATVVANGAAEIVDNKASREFEAARKRRPKDPRPVTIEQVKRKPRKQQVRLTDNQARQAHEEYWHSLDTLKVICERWNVSESALRKRWQKLGLPLAGQGTNRYLRQPKTAVVPAAPKATETAVVPAQTAAMDPTPATPQTAEFVPADILAQIQAFRQEMAAIGVPVEVSMSLRLVKEVRL